MKDQISALMDDEISLSDAEYLYTALKAGGESSECWTTYHLIGDAMRGSPVFQRDFRDRLMQKLEAEPVALAPRKRVEQDAPGKSAKRSPVMWSVAASMTAVMFVGWMVLQQQAQQTEDILPVEIAQDIPAEYLFAHQSVAPSSAAYYIQSAAFSESSK
ncbi:Anti-sigma-E factor RseA [Methylophilaceae bacterium]|nr:Anti-sigma-E factor RseA [Methylophilaceae bacterium]